MSYQRSFLSKSDILAPDQIRRSSRSVCANAGVEQAAETAAFPPANLAEAWRKRRYVAAFVAKLNDCESVLKDYATHKAAETQTWIEFAVKCEYITVETGRELYTTYNQIIGSFVNMILNLLPWLIDTKLNGKIKTNGK